MGPAQIDRALAAIADRLVSLAGDRPLALVGVRTGGVPLAERLARLVADRTGTAPPLGVLDITLYRDDVFRGLEQPEVGPTDITFPVGDRILCLVDDVLYTGRTVRAALDELMDFGRPRRVLLAVLVDRGGRELPIQADLVGEVLDVAADESVQVRLKETHGKDEVMILGEASR